MTTEELDLAVWPIFHQMSRRGLLVSFERLYSLKEEVAAKTEEQLALVEMYCECPINPSSGDQVAEWLDKQGFHGKRTDGGRLATDERSLRQMPFHPGIDAILEYRGLRKLEGTFIDPVIEIAKLHRGLVHPRWRLTKVRSGRVATEDPNLLAFPSRDEMGKKVRSCFVARPGYKFVSADYSQLEPRIVAGLSGDPKLLKIYGEDRDLYSEIAAELMITRLVAKILTLGILYGMSAQRLFEQLQLAGCFTGNAPTYSLEACADLIHLWFDTYERVKLLVADTIREAKQAGGWAHTAMRRGRYLPGLFLTGNGWPNGKLREEAERQAFNHRIQGTGMEMLKRAMLRVDERVLPEVHPLLAIHDELIYEVPRAGAFAAPAIAGHMTAVFEGVTLKVSTSVADDWGSLK